MATTRLLILILVAIVVLPFLAVADAAAQAVEHRAAQSLAIVFSRGIDGTSCGNGFFVGDGTLLVTARQVIFPRRPLGLHQGEAFVTVLSPHLGEAAEAQVVAQDRELEVVLLRVPWRGHPALQLAAEAGLVTAEKLQVLAFANEQSAVAAGRPALLQSPPQPQTATLDINAVMVRRNATRTVATSTAPPGPGWAGAPMLLSADAVAGCYLRTQADGSAGAGVACGAIRRLIETAGASAALTATATHRPPPGDAPEATLAYLRGISSSAAGEAEAARRHFQHLLQLRPSSAVGHRDLAGQLHALGLMQESQDHYAKGLELEPLLVSARVLYGQLLDERMLPKAAEEHLMYAWHNGGGSTAAILPLCNLLRRQGRDRECLPLLEEAVKRRAGDGHLWSYLGQARRAVADDGGAASAFARSADLMPDDPTPRLQAARQFELAGLRDRAEEQYRTLLAQHPGAATAHFHFARFISRESTRRAEAIRHAEQALSLADTPGAPPRNVIQSLLEAIRAGRTSPANELRL